MKHLKSLMWLKMGSVGICTCFPPLSPWESPFAARFGSLCSSFPWLLQKLNFERFPDAFIPSVCQSDSQCPSCKPIRTFYNPVFNRCLEGKQCLTTPRRLEILLYWGISQQVSGARCPFATLGAILRLMTVSRACCPQMWLMGNDLGKGRERGCFQSAHTSVPTNSLLYSCTQTRYIV